MKNVDTAMPKQTKRSLKQRCADLGQWCRENRPTKADFRYALTVLRHPIDEFWEMKRAQKGNVFVASLMVVFLFLTTIFDRQARSFVHNMHYNTPLDVFYELRMLLIPGILFIVANWSITTLMNGKGTAKDIFLATGYSLQPLILMRVVVPLLSYVLSLNDSAYLKIVEIMGWVWFGLMLYIAISQIHEYSLGKTFLTLILTVVAAIIIVLICLLFFSLIQELSGFVYSIYREMFLRIYS